MSWVKGLHVSVMGACVFLFCLVVRILRECFEMCESHSCACVCRDMAMCLTGLSICLHVMTSSGSSLYETSCAISASVLMLNVPVRLITIRMILMSAFISPWVCRANFRGSYRLCMRSMISGMLPSVEYLYLII